jgi:A/G-specific adenine glycosylase
MAENKQILRPEARPPFRRRLLRWFDQNRRDLPWRADRDPYHVWVSEIMLQQTRVAVVRDRYPRFLEQFPTVESLATAELPEVLAAWSGLGYYRRARNLHAAARQMVAGGKGFPRTSEALASLPGIGRYTAAAIASIAFDQPCAVVDGNVLRVLGRLFRVAGRRVWPVATELLSRRRPGDFNQAMMELGATTCLPGAPLCPQCPLSHWCRTRGPGASSQPARRRKQEVAYGLAMRNRSVFLIRRGEQRSLMPGMWELPEANGARHGKPCLRLRHAITNTDYSVSVYQSRPPHIRGRWVRFAELPRLPLTGLTQKILRAVGII